MQDHTNQQLGNYRIGKLLGRGGFADVYLATHIYLNTQAAIKVLHTLQTEQEMEGFIEEARIIGRLQHPHIVQVLDFGIDKNTPFLVMTYAPHGTMRMRYPRGTRLPLPAVVGYIKQIASALQYVHDQKLIYRDLKPENLLLKTSNDILLSDFGIALVAQTSYNPGAMATAGTIAYMPPEQLQGRPRLASDQYALGIIVYEWLSGERPFAGSFTEMASQHLLAPPPPLREKLPLLAPDVERVIMTALAKDPLQRFGSVRAFANALEQAAGQARGGPVTLPGVNDGPRFPPTLPQQMNFPSSTPGMVSSQVAQPPSTPPLMTPQAMPPMATPHFTPEPASLTPPAGAYALPTSVDYGRPAPTSGQSRPNSDLVQTQRADAPYSHNAAAQTVAARPRRISRRAVLASLGGLVVVGGAATYATWYATQHQSTPVAASSTPPPVVFPSGHLYLTYGEHVLGVYDVQWSPTRRQVVTVGNDSTARIWDPLTGKTLLVYRKHTASVNSVSWSPEGVHIATGGSDLSVQVWEAATGKTQYTYFGHSQNVRTVAWSPTGQRVASAGDDGKIHVWEAMTGKRLYLYTGHVGRVWTVAWSPDGKYIASGGDDKTAQIWDATTGKLLHVYRGHTNQVKSLEWSPDGGHIVSGSDDRSVQVWNTKTAKMEFKYTGQFDVLNGVAWSPDGQRIASASGDYTTHLWDAFTGKNVTICKGHLLAVHAVSWSRDGSRIVSVSDDHTAKVWKAV